MRAGDLQVALPTVDRTTTVARATRIIAETGRVGVLVADQGGNPVSVISALDVLRLALPDYVIEDPSLARVLDEKGVGDLLSRLAEHTIGDLIDDDRVRVRRLLWVDPDATLVEIAGLLASENAFAIGVRHPKESAHVVTLPTVMEAMLGYANQQGGEIA